MLAAVTAAKVCAFPLAAETTLSPALIVPEAVTRTFAFPQVTVHILPAAAPTLTTPTKFWIPEVGRTVPFALT